MGEYIKYRDDSVHIGDKENIFFATYQALKREEANISRASGYPTLDHYLQESNGYRYRFPFPWEDAIDIGEHMYSDYAYAVEVPRFWPMQDVHRDIPVHLSCDNRWAVTSSITCPASERTMRSEEMEEWSGYVPIEIFQQQLVKGKLWTVCRCGYCRKPFVISEEFAEELSWMIREFEGDRVTGMAARVMEGYR